MKLVIPVSKWLHGKRDSACGEDSFLLRPKDGKMCCLGIYFEALGIPRERLEGKRTPSDLSSDVLPKDHWTRTALLTNRLIDVNDGHERPCERRKIKQLFKKQGVEVEFVP